VTAAPKLGFSFRDYLSVDADSPVKHELLDGMILARLAGTPEHAAIAASVSALLHRQLAEKKCRVFSSDLRVRVLATGFAGYPDVTVVCTKLEVDPEDANTATNPAVVVEVTSPSTDAYDRGEKLRQYQRIPSLSHIVLVAHDARRIEVWSRTDGGWTTSVAGTGEHALLAVIDCELDVDDVYRDPLAG
jgi:Uma2 family endonuclease